MMETTENQAAGADIDLFFASLPERDKQYNARASVVDFDACVREYADLSALARQQCVGLYDLRYGPSSAERLDLFPVTKAKSPSPLLIFIHGGYWRAQTKQDAALIAKVFTDAGVAVATLEYPLLPMVTLAETVRAVRNAVAWLHAHSAQYGVDTGRIYASGSSAGGHLAAMLMAPGWQTDYELPESVIRGGVCLSGLYDIRPLCDTHVNEWLRLHTEQAYRLSPLFQLPDPSLPLVLTVGGLETDGFKNQTDAYERACRQKGLAVTRVQAPDCNHFNLLCEMVRPDSELTRATLEMIFSG
jgi:arylformamidase